VQPANDVLIAVSVIAGFVDDPADPPGIEGFYVAPRRRITNQVDVDL
jgi:hypothetical protein